MLLERSFTDGDILIVFAKTATGAARCAFYEAHQLANPENADPEKWREGVKIDSQGRHLAYGVRSGDKVRVIPASSALLFGQWESVGHVRPHPPLAHAITHTLDITETRGFLKLGLKNSSLLGIVSEKTAGGPPRTVDGMTTAISMGRTVEKDDGNGGRIKTSEVFDGGQIPDTAPGEKLSVLTDGRPHPNALAFEDVLIRDIAQGFGLPESVVLSIIKLNGPGVRFAMEVADQWIKDRLDQLDEFCLRYWVFDTACEIEAGRLPECDDPYWMQKLKLTKRKSLTIDRGREGKQRLEEAATGFKTLEDWCEEETGDDWRDHVDQVIEEHAYKVNQCEAAGFRLADVFSPRQGAAVVSTEEPPDPENSPDQDS
jgi:hypothetical protein